MLNTLGSGKSPDAFRTISEASDELGVPPHVLRFWEGKFSNLRPLKRAGGRRFYRPQDMALLRGLKSLLQEDGYTIKGVQKLIKENGIQSVRDRAHNGLIDRSDYAGELSTNSDSLIDEIDGDTGAILDKAVKRMEMAIKKLDAVLETK